MVINCARPGPRCQTGLEELGKVNLHIDLNGTEILRNLDVPTYIILLPVGLTDKGTRRLNSVPSTDIAMVHLEVFGVGDGSCLSGYHSSPHQARTTTPSEVALRILTPIIYFIPK